MHNNHPLTCTIHRLSSSHPLPPHHPPPKNSALAATRAVRALAEGHKGNRDILQVRCYGWVWFGGCGDVGTGWGGVGRPRPQYMYTHRLTQLKTTTTIDPSPKQPTTT